MPLAPFLPAEAAPYPVLLDAYPCPAFIVRAQSTLRPVWANQAYDAAFGCGLDLKDSFVHVLATAEDGQRFGMWSVEEGRPGKKRCRDDEVEFTTSVLKVRVRVVGGEADLRLVKTRVDDVLVITSTLALRSPNDVSPVPSKRVREDTLSLGPLPPLKLQTHLLTPEGTPVIPTQSPISSRSSSTAPWPHKLPHTLGAVVPSPYPTATQALFESYPWENTPLGDRSTWSERLRAAVNIMQTSPHPVSHLSSGDPPRDHIPQTALWWGSEYVLIYNDEYSKVSTVWCVLT